MFVMNYSHIVWDWNGTLLDDTLASADAVDRMMKRRRLGSLTVEDYRERITYPVINLYYESGFDFKRESYEDMCAEYIGNYRANRRLMGLQPGSGDILKHFAGHGFRQHIVSASEYKILMAQINEYGLSGYFETISGLKDHRADTKTHLAEKLINETGCEPGRFLFIGDTLHDYEIARQLGAGCCLVSNGHCSKKRLMETGIPVFSNLEALLDSMRSESSA